MFFGDYLVKRKILTRKQVLSALAYQCERAPSLFRLAVENDLLSEEKLVRIANGMLENNDFLTVVRRYKYLNEKNIQKLLDIQAKARPLFGQILVDLNYLTGKETQRYILECLAGEVGMESSDLNERSPAPESSVLSQAPQTPPSLGQDQMLMDAPELAVDWPDIEFSTLDPSLIEELLSLFDEVKKEELERAIMGWSEALDKELLRGLYRELHTLKGTARFLKAYILEFVIHNMENLLSDITRSAEFFGAEDRLKLEDLYLRGLDVLWMVRGKISESHSEEVIWVSELKKDLEDFIISIMQMQSKSLEVANSGSLDDFKDQF